MRALIALIALVTVSAAPAVAQSYTVPMDQAGLLRLPEDASAIVVGNPAIADATMFDSRTVFISGRSYGLTNIIALNAEGRVIYSRDLSVTQSMREHVQVFHNQDQASFVCNPVCRPVPLIGDSQERFTNTLTQRAGIRDAAAGASEGSSRNDN